jgi:hypothetical protein
MMNDEVHRKEGVVATVVGGGLIRPSLGLEIVGRLARSWPDGRRDPHLKRER